MSADKRRVAVGSAEEWLRHARSDLALAYLGVEAEAVLIEQICFHAQQAIEKSLKSWLIQNKLRFPPVHDIEQLLEIAREANLVLPEWADDLLEVTPYAVETRYPGYWDEISARERDRALDLAAQTIEWVKQHLPQPASAGAEESTQ